MPTEDMVPVSETKDSLLLTAMQYPQYQHLYQFPNPQFPHSNRKEDQLDGEYAVVSIMGKEPWA